MLDSVLIVQTHYLVNTFLESMNGDRERELGIQAFPNPARFQKHVRQEAAGLAKVFRNAPCSNFSPSSRQGWAT